LIKRFIEWENLRCVLLQAQSVIASWEGEAAPGLESSACSVVPPGRTPFEQLDRTKVKRKNDVTAIRRDLHLISLKGKS